MSNQDDKTPLLPAYTFTRQKSIRYRRGAPPSPLSGAAHNRTHLRHTGSLKVKPQIPGHVGDHISSSSNNNNQANDGPHQTRALVEEQIERSRPGPTILRSTGSFNHDSEGHVIIPWRGPISTISSNTLAQANQVPPPLPPRQPIADNGVRDRRYLTTDFRGSNISQQRDGHRSPSCLPDVINTSPMFPNRFTETTSDEINRQISPLPRSRTFVSDRLLEAMANNRAEGSDPRKHKSQNIKFSQTAAYPSQSNSDASQEQPEKRYQSFPQTFMDRFKRRSLSPHPPPSPSSSRSSLSSEVTCEQTFRRVASLPLPRRKKSDRGMRSQSSLPMGHPADGWRITSNSRPWRESEACFALLPTPRCETPTSRGIQSTNTISSPQTQLRTKSTNSPQTSDHGRPPIPPSYHREQHDSTSSGSSAEEFPRRHSSLPPLHRVKGGRRVNRDIDLDQRLGVDDRRDSKFTFPTVSTSTMAFERITRQHFDSAGADSSTPTLLRWEDSLSSIEEMRVLRSPSPLQQDGPNLIDILEATHIVEDTPPKRESYSDLEYLIKNDEEYLQELEQTLSDYQEMCARTPAHIRQHFDVLFKHLNQIKSFQVVLCEALHRASGNLSCVAEVFRNEQFELYSSYMVITPAAQKDLYRYSIYFNEHFPGMKRSILRPSSRINFYAMALDGLKQGANQEEKANLQRSINYLNQVKRCANTEMTIKSVVSSPVDLRLGGDMLHIGELMSTAGGSLQRKKYQLILFENMLVITSPKISFFKYKIHYRAEHIQAVEANGIDELVLCVLSEGQHQMIALKFKAKTAALRNQWVSELQKMIIDNGLESPASQMPSGNIAGLLRPLSLFSIYPQLRTALEDEREPKSSLSADEACQQLLNLEKVYRRQLKTLLHPEVLPPPEKLSEFLGKLYDIHSQTIHPALEEAKNGGISKLLSCFLQHLEKLDVYTDYLVIRSQFTLLLDKAVEARLYIAPIHHLVSYIVWLKQIARITDYKELAEHALTLINDCIMKAQVRHLKEVIKYGRVDFLRSGNLIRNDILDVKSRKRGFRHGMYQALLFRKVIVLTKPRPPYYEFVWDIWLDQINLGPPCTSACAFKLEVRQGRGREPDTYEFQATSEMVKQKWMHCLQQELVQQAKQIRRRISASSLY